MATSNFNVNFNDPNLLKAFEIIINAFRGATTGNIVGIDQIKFRVEKNENTPLHGVATDMRGIENRADLSSNRRRFITCRFVGGRYICS